MVSTVCSIKASGLFQHDFWWRNSVKRMLQCTLVPASSNNAVAQRAVNAGEDRLSFRMWFSCGYQRPVFWRSVVSAHACCGLQTLRSAGLNSPCNVCGYDGDDKSTPPSYRRPRRRSPRPLPHLRLLASPHQWSVTWRPVGIGWSVA